MANRSTNRGPKSPIGRLRSLRNLRGVGDKIFRDPAYADRILKDGMNYKTQKEKRLATKITNEYNRKINKHLLKPKTPDVEGLRKWRNDYPDKSNPDDMTLDEAIELRKTIETSKHKQSKQPEFKVRAAASRNYGSGIYNPLTVEPKWRAIEDDTAPKKPNRVYY
tara:strand:- start:33 stop:527 length:495 start_codon:yes stop_codon:yes gene_type:complete